jgi:hypothetical protein
MVVQVTSEGNFRRRSRKALPTGLKHSTTCRHRRTCGDSELLAQWVACAAAKAAAGALTWSIKHP